MSNYVTRGNYSATPKNYFKLKSATDDKGRRSISFIGQMNGQDVAYNFLAGYLVKLEAKDNDYKGETIRSLQIHLASPDGREVDIISTSRYGAFVRDVLLRLLPLEEISYVQLRPFEWSTEKIKDKVFVGCSVRHHDTYLSELYDTMKLPNENKEYLPKVDMFKSPSGKDMMDTTKRDLAIDTLIELINSKLKYKSAGALAGLSGANYLPADVSNYEEVTEDVGFDGEVPF